MDKFAALLSDPWVIAIGSGLVVAILTYMFFSNNKESRKIDTEGGRYIEGDDHSVNL